MKIYSSDSDPPNQENGKIHALALATQTLITARVRRLQENLQGKCGHGTRGQRDLMGDQQDAAESEEAATTLSVVRDKIERG